MIKQWLLGTKVCQRLAMLDSIKREYEHLRFLHNLFNKNFEERIIELMNKFNKNKYWWMRSL